MSDLLVCWRALVDEGIDPMEAYEPELLEYRRRRPVGEELLDACLQLGRMLVVMGRLDGATGMFRRMLEMAAEIDDRPNIARAECELAWVLHRQGRTVEAMETVERTSALAFSTGDRRLIASVEQIMGMICYEHGDHAEALEHFERQLEVSRELADRHGIAAAMGRLGMIYCDQGEHQRALEYYREQLSIVQELGDRQRTSDAHCTMGILYQAMGDNDRALECYAEQLRISRELGYRSGIGSATANMGNIYHEQGEYPRALECFELLLGIARELGDPQRISNAIGCMANLYARQGRYAQALECYRDALASQREIGYLAGMTSWLYGAAEVIVELVLDVGEMPAYLPPYIPGLLEAGPLPADGWRKLSLEEARRQAEECAEISSRLRHSNALWATRLLIARIDAAEGDPDAAIRKLHTLLGESADDDLRAELYYYLWSIHSSYHPVSIGDQGSAELYRTEALRLFEDLFEKTPYENYRQRIEELGQNPGIGSRDEHRVT
jgi:tetratricopeptide (TPR) repeat protein